MKHSYGPDFLNSLQDIIEDDIAVQAMEFQFEAPKHNWPIPYGVFLGEMLRCLDEYVKAGNIEPIQKLSTTAISGWQDDEIINKYMAFANLQLADKFLKANNVYKAMQYYKRGITYRNLKSTTDIENDISITPIQKYTNEKKKIALPLAEKIWSYDSNSNLLMRKQVAELIVELLPSLELRVPQVDTWLKNSDLVPKAIIDRCAQNDYGNTKSEAIERENIKNKIYADLGSENSKYL